MNINSAQKSDLQILTVQDARIDAAAAIQFKDRAKQLVAQGDSAVVLDLTAVDFIDSSGLGAIVAIRKHLGTARPLHLAGLSAIVEKVFTLTRMDRVFEIYGSVEDALQREVRPLA